ncbi:MAG: hypothetical protein IPF99_40830 [Deltaproteobacteria bacterium]|nr:hypothetical protein [Deltaproteobacteria bacterium]
MIDLNMMGMRTGGTTRITRSNTTTPRNGTLRASCQGNTVGQVAFRYTPTAAGRLAISTDNAGTMPVAFDTVAWALSTCAPSVGDAGTGNLGCDDDSGSDPRGLSSRFVTSAPVAAGTPIFIIVAGYGSATTSTGTFELSVTEVATVAVGGMCDTAGQTSVCATGATCVGGSATTPGTCTAEGALNGACRATGMACDGCEPANTTTVCATGSSCVDRRALPWAPAAQGGACRTASRATEPRCDGMLACSSASVCRTVVAVGAACEPSNTTTVCATGGSCVATTPGAAMGTCRAAGTAAGTACREAAPRCDTGLDCSTMTPEAGVCALTIASGAACVVGFAGDRCAMGTACLPTTPTAGTCSMTATAETEPNNAPAMAQAPITATRIYSGMASSMDRDCFGVTVPAGGSIFAETNLSTAVSCPTGDMPTADPVITVYNPAGDQIATSDDTSGRGLCGTSPGATGSASAASPPATTPSASVGSTASWPATC